MLIEISCERFKQKTITFKNGLNCVLGDDNASNSIGKSTFLLIIDFVFGGKTYSQSIDVKNNIGNHSISFKFLFNDIVYEFYRDFEKPNVVNMISPNIQEIEINDYNNWLKKQYQQNIEDITFRAIVSLYSRIYGKDNLNEKSPLEDTRKNKNIETEILNLVKLFGEYPRLKRTKTEIEDLDKIIKAYKDAKKHSIISSLNKTKFNDNKFQIKQLKGQLEELTKDIATQSLDIDTIKMAQTKDLLDELRKLKRKKTIYEIQIDKLRGNINEILSINELDKEDLLSFFPNINIDKLEAVQTFHSQLKSNLHDEISSNIKEREVSLSLIDRRINELSEKLSDIENNNSLSRGIVSRIVDIQSKIVQIEGENNGYMQEYNMKDDKKSKEMAYGKLVDEILNNIQKKINSKISTLNDEVCNSGKQSPQIQFISKKNYTFATPMDNGTGTNYKSLILFDYAILLLTSLPFLIHDSVLFKQIEDNTIEGILSLYNNSTKQIFIALDKISSYSHVSMKILKENKVLELSKGGGELFGYSWSNK